MKNDKKMARVPVGADAWLYKKNPYSKKHNKSQYDKYEKDRPEVIKRHREQRANKGYSDHDWWNFDSFIMGAVCNVMVDFIEHGHGYFAIGDEQMDPITGAYPEGTLENYNATLGAIYYALYNHLTNDECEPGWEERFEEARQAMILYAEYVHNFWD